MDKQAFLNDKYLKLCQQLGDAQLKREQLDELIESLKTQIKTLNDSFSIMAEYEVTSKAKAKAEAQNG